MIDLGPGPVGVAQWSSNPPQDLKIMSSNPVGLLSCRNEIYYNIYNLICIVIVSF
jgi:hypothetical protein